MEENTLFTLVSREHFENISRYEITPEYVDALKALVPEGWIVARSGVWMGARREEAELPVQGFKIHVSSTPRHALETLERVVPECVRRGVQFKIAADPTLLSLLLSKRYGRGGSGKFMTIYPPQALFHELIEAIHQATRDTELSGPYILSDRRYKDSRVVFYRYGGFQTVQVLRIDGSREPVIYGPGGEKVPDERTPYFQLPAWVEDPFGGSAGVQHEGPALLGGRYRVDSVLGFSNAGGVYAGTDTATGEEVVIKEGRPHAGHWDTGTLLLDAVTLLEREHQVLQRLSPLGFVPRPLALFQEWEHWFLVQERLRLPTFQHYWSSEQHIFAPHVNKAEKREAFVPRFRALAASLIDRVEKVHGQGVILGDLSPHNVMVNTETLEVSLIDFESAALADDDESGFMAYARVWGTPGFRNPARSRRKELRPEDDFYAVGMLLYGAVVPVQDLFALSPAARGRFLDGFIALGLPEQIRQTIHALLEGDVAGAREILERWDEGPRPLARAA
jgi:hypothetical protein